MRFTTVMDKEARCLERPRSVTLGWAMVSWLAVWLIFTSAALSSSALHLACHDEHTPPSSSDCAVCAFAHGQVHLDDASPMVVLPPPCVFTWVPRDACRIPPGPAAAFAASRAPPAFFS
jgi:hypothetical protein